MENKELKEYSIIFGLAILAMIFLSAIGFGIALLLLHNMYIGLGVLLFIMIAGVFWGGFQAYQSLNLTIK